MAEKIEIVAELKDLVSGHLKDITSQIDRLDGKLANVGKSGGALGSGGGIMSQVLGANLLSNAINRAANAVFDFAKDIPGAYMRMEQYEARLTTLLHDRLSAITAIRNITIDAQKTTFDLNSLVQSNSMLIGAGAGAKEARKVTMDLGNAIAATGGGSDELNRMAVNLAQIKSIGKASALDVRQFMYANIPIYEMLSKSLHKNVKEIKDMNISYKDLKKALSDAREEGGMFFNGLENASNTLTGKVSNLGDAWDKLKTTIGRSEQGILKESTTWATEMVNNFERAFSNADKMVSSFEKYGAKNYTIPQKYGGFLMNLVGGTGERSKEIQYQDALQQNFVRGEMTLVAALKNSASLSSMIANLTNEKYINTIKADTSGEADEANIKVNRDLAILKGVKDDLKDVITGLKKSAKEDKAIQPANLETLAKANRQTVTNITIENLVREINATYEGTSEASKMSIGDFAKMVSKVLTGAVNDVTVAPN